MGVLDQDMGIKGVPTVEEEELVQHLIQMCDRGLGLSATQLKMKVYEITKTRWTPFKNGIPGGGWMQWWKNGTLSCHFDHPKLLKLQRQVVFMR
jgi:hypothetical protein